MVNSYISICRRKPSCDGIVRWSWAVRMYFLGDSFKIVVVWLPWDLFTHTIDPWTCVVIAHMLRFLTKQLDLCCSMRSETGESLNEWSCDYYVHDNLGYDFICRFGSGTGRIWLDDVSCTGSESRLTYCTNRGIGSNNCGHSEDVAIYCGSTCMSANINLSLTSTNKRCWEATRKCLFVCVQWFTYKSSLLLCILTESGEYNSGPIM